MERIFTHCPNCDDHMEVEYIKGGWYCENCGTNLTKQVDNQRKREAEFNRKNRRK